jgi:hypothetical protein
MAAVSMSLYPASNAASTAASQGRSRARLPHAQAELWNQVTIVERQFRLDRKFHKK